jgi:predicted DNA-binding transcriptional regulator AlpA
MKRSAKVELATPRRSLQTVEAARYLGLSASLLRKMRKRGPHDPSGAGPQYIRISSQLVVYDIAELDAWLEARAARSRESAESPQRTG